MYFPSGSRCTWVGEWNDSSFNSGPVQAIHDASSYLENNCNMAVESSSSTDPGFWTTSGRRTVTLKLRTLIDRSSEDDMRLDCEHAFWIGMNQTPDASRVSNVTLPGKASTDTGTQPEPEQTPNTPNAAITWWEKLKAQAQGASIGIVVGAVAVVGLVIFVAVED